MSDGPDAVVTFLITDVEGATHLLDEYGEAAVRALDRHEVLIRQVVRAHDGTVFSASGDSFGAWADRVTQGSASDRQGPLDRIRLASLAATTARPLDSLRPTS